jgi:hypothetical protein
MTSKPVEEGALVSAAKAIGKAAGKVAALAGAEAPEPAKQPAKRASKAKLAKKDKTHLPRRVKKAQKKAARTL